MFGIFTFYIAGTRNIVYRDIIKSCKNQKTVEGNTGFSAFIIGICALANMWNAAWYNSTTEKIKISRVDVDYMDGTSQTLQIASDFGVYLNGKVDCWEER